MSKLISEDDYKKAEQAKFDALQKQTGTDIVGINMQLTAAAFSAGIKKRLFGDKKDKKEDE